MLITRYHDVASAAQPVKIAERSAVCAFLRILIASLNVISCSRTDPVGAYAPVIAALWRENDSPKMVHMIPMQRIVGRVKTQRIPDQSFHLVFDWHSWRRHKFAVLQTDGQMAAKQETALIRRGDLSRLGGLQCLRSLR